MNVSAHASARAYICVVEAVRSLYSFEHVAFCVHTASGHRRGAGVLVREVARTADVEAARGRAVVRIVGLEVFLVLFAVVFVLPHKQVRPSARLLLVRGESNVLTRAQASVHCVRSCACDMCMRGLRVRVCVL